MVQQARASSERWQRIGIAVVAMAAMAALLLDGDRGDAGSSAGETIRRTTGIGQRRSVRLSDRTRVDLSVRSAISHPRAFAPQARMVMLSGEAFFVVAKDTVRPFIVTADSAMVVATTGAFAVRAYPGQVATEIVVDSGSVRVGRAGSAGAAQTIVRAGERARIAADGTVRPPEAVDPQRFLGWRRGRIEFRDAQLRDALVELERWHDVELVIRDSVVANRRVTASFASHQTLTEILDGIALQLGARYDRAGRSITFRLER